VRAVVFDAMGVLYRSGDDLVELLMPFARRRGSPLSDAEIGAIYRRAFVGDLTAAELWKELGVNGDPADLDREYLAGHELTPGIVDLLDELRERGVWLGCISNDVAEWSRALRATHGLDQKILHWTISGEVHVRKPDDAIYRAFLESTGFAPEGVTFIDDRARNIDAAAALGFDTILVDFAGVGQDPRRVTSVAELSALLRARA
jgi:HAD superfamily hydrolase (TIGR01509 family)